MLVDPDEMESMNVEHMGHDGPTDVLSFPMDADDTYAEAVPAYAGDIWSFITPPYGTVDDFEQYNDDCERIFFAWEDGLGHNGGTDINLHDGMERGG